MPSLRAAARALPALLLVARSAMVDANMYDVLMPKYTSTCKNGCADWASAGGAATNQSVINAMFASGAPSGNACAMPANHAGDHECDCGQKNATEYIFDSYQGPWCFCKGEDTQLYCTPPKYVPEQINLQLASSEVVVVGFVTYEDSLPSANPVAMFGKDEASMTQVEGVSHWYTPPGRNGAFSKDGYTNPYTMSYIKFPVAERQQYVYKVKSGSSGAEWSATFAFRAPYKSGVTRIATYGDMGHSHYNCMENVKADCASGGIDAIVHMGDHAYNLGFDDDRRGDAYMNAFQGALATCPWFPIIGNHESSDGDHYKHYEAIAYGEEYGNPASLPAAPRGFTSTATSRLGAHLTAGTFYAMGLHGSTPSNTSRYASSTIGLVHMVGLDLNSLDPEQLAWLEQDLIQANLVREQVPWIMVMSHFPIFAKKKYDSMSLAHYMGDENLGNYSLDYHDYVPCPPGSDEVSCPTIGAWKATIGHGLQPLFKKYGVDIYNAGHVHSYETTWPLCDFTKGELCNGKQDYVNPGGTMHITEGNGGVPGVKGTYAVKNCTTPGGFCRKTASGGAYARITAYNASHLTYEHVQNNGGEVTDSWTIVQTHHGAFDLMK